MDILTMKRTLVRINKAIHARESLHHVAINAAKLVNMQTNNELASDVRNSHLVGIDGKAIVWALRLFGWKNVERVAGIDLFVETLAMSEREGFRPFLLGAKPEILERAMTNIEREHPAIQFAGHHHGYFSAEQEQEIVSMIRESGADCLFVGMPTPRKERFLAKYRDELNVPFIMGVGGSFDVVSGHVKRAPSFMQTNGLEWLYRIYQEPRRMWWRYARTNTLFAIMILRGLFSRGFALGPEQTR